MALLLQDVLVGFIVVACAVFSAWRLMSPRLRLRTLELLAPALDKLAPELLTRLRTQTIGQLAGSCGSCSNNKDRVSR